MRTLLNLFIVDPVNLSVRGKCLAVFACTLAIFGVAWLTRLNSPAANYPFLVASMGASAIILFFAPSSPLAQPWPLIGGQIVSALVGIACTKLPLELLPALVCAIAGCMLAMLLLRCLHPPGAATALIPLLAGDPITSLGYEFVLVPIGLNVCLLFVIALVLNRWLLSLNYPVLTRSAEAKAAIGEVRQPWQLTSMATEDLAQVLRDNNIFMDVSPAALHGLVAEVQKQRFERLKGRFTCADIMVTNVYAAEYGTEVEEAWRIMQREQLKAIPVIDRSQRVIGIVSGHDFFKFINLNATASLQQQFSAFIRRTPDVVTTKPEAIGHIMTAKVMTLAENTSIVDLVPLMADRGFRQIPIVNNEKRLVGMVYQANLIAALYNLPSLNG